MGTAEDSPRPRGGQPRARGNVALAAGVSRDERPSPFLSPSNPLSNSTAELEPVVACLACGSTERDFHHETDAMVDASAQRFRFSRCAECGLVYLDPRVAPADLGRFYTESYLPYRGPEAWGRWRPLVASGLRATDRRRVAAVRALRPLGPDTRVLDVGCGHPTFLEALRRARGCRAVGVDFSGEGWLDQPERWAGLELHEGDLADVHLTGSFDVVTMWHYLEHDYAPVDTLRRVRGLVNADAHLVIEVPDHDSWSRRRYGEHWAGYHTPRHTALWEPSTMRVLLERAGWRVESIEPRGTLDPWTLVWMSRQERRGIDWRASMAPHFVGFVAGRALLWPALSLFEKARGRGGDGFITAVARPG